jgi:glycosyltransferase involved in cell wall biosynthesis
MSPIMTESSSSTRRTPLAGKSLAIHAPDLSGGGLERLLLDLVPAFSEAGLRVTLLLGSLSGALSSQVPPGIKVVSLGGGRQLTALWPIVRYLRRERPDILLVNNEHPAILSLWAKRLARARTAVVICQHSVLSAQSRRRSWQFRMLPVLFRLFLRLADGIVAVSDGVARDMAAISGLTRDRIRVIYNGVVGSEFERKKNEDLSHPWFGAAIPVIVAAGRFVPAKDFATLIRAFALLCADRDARLIILGDGPLRADLTRLAQSLDVADRIDMPGFCENPMPYLKRASLVVLSSKAEGFGMVLAEALACGTPVASTDCPHGPAEVLDHGRFGALAPVGDPAGLAEAMSVTLRNPLPRETLIERGNLFTVRSSADQYLRLFEALAPRVV